MLCGENVALRPFTMDDVPKVAEWVNSPLAGGPHSAFRFRSPRELEKQFDEDGLVAHDRGNLVLATAQDDPAGVAWYWTPVPLFDTREVGVQIPDPRLREGDLEGRALRLLVHYLFSGFAIHRIQSHVVASDQRLLAACAAAGMSQEGRLRQTYFLRGSFEDEVLFSILRPEWEADGRYGGLRELFKNPVEPNQGGVGFLR